MSSSKSQYPKQTLEDDIALEGLSAEQIMGLNKAHLVSVGEEHFLHKDVATAFLAMQAAAAQGGVDMQICSSFRSFDKQLSIWNRKWRGDLPLNTLDNKVLIASELDPLEKIHAIMLWSALPGASRHHWGSDFDVYDRQSIKACQHKLELIPSEYENNGPCANLANWIDSNAAKHGFYLPYAHYVGGVANEPWHVSHYATAQAIQSHFIIDKLYAQLEAADILGKSIILEHLPLLVKQYTFNLGP
jgi:LAS superfamily LD-carboxypeptidase LdcB